MSVKYLHLRAKDKLGFYNMSMLEHVANLTQKSLSLRGLYLGL